MNRKNRKLCVIVLFIFVLAALLLVIQLKRQAGTDNTVSTSESETDADELVQLKELAEQSEVLLNCKIPKIKEKVEILNFSYYDFENPPDEFMEQINKALLDNPEHIKYSVTSAAAGEQTGTSDNPYTCAGYDHTLVVFKSRNNNIKKWKKLSRKKVLDRVEVFFQSISVDIEERSGWSVEKKEHGSFGEDMTMYEVHLCQTYDGIPVVDEGLFDWNSQRFSSPMIMVTYGERGWENIQLCDLMQLKGTGEYIDTSDILTSDELIEKLEENLKKQISMGKQKFTIKKATLAYFFSDDKTLRPVWWVTAGWRSDVPGRETISLEESYYIDIETGETIEDALDSTPD
jgi:hypothetical protein